MNANDVLKQALESARMVMMAYLSDLSDQDLMVRPVPESNMVGWQLGHLVMSEAQMLDGIKAGASPALPSGFAEMHSKEAAASNGPLAKKAEYLAVMEKQRAATLAVLATLSAEDLTLPGPEAMRAYAPTVGALLGLIAGHEMMHTGQVAVLRRKLGKPILM